MPLDRLITDPMRTLAYGTDASFYRRVDLSRHITQNPELKAKVRRKYRLKTTTGYGMNALLQQQVADDPWAGGDTVPDIACCGFDGDKGFTLPELNAKSLKQRLPALPEGCSCGVSASRPCQIGLASHSGIPYRSSEALLDDCSTAISKAGGAAI